MENRTALIGLNKNGLPLQNFYTHESPRTSFLRSYTQGRMQRLLILQYPWDIARLHGCLFYWGKYSAIGVACFFQVIAPC